MFDGQTWGDNPQGSNGPSRQFDNRRGEQPRQTASSHLPPQNLEAEEAILGAMIASPKAIEAVVDVGLRDIDFHRPSHKTIFTTILALAERDAVDELTLVNELRSKGTLDEIGGPVAVLSLAERVPAVANARAYAREVLNQAVLRNLVEAGHDISKLGYEHPDEPDRLVDMAGQIISDMAQQRETSDFAKAVDLLGPIYDDISERAQNGGKGKGTQTGFADFDKMTGGLQPSALIILAARPAMGKSAFALNIAEHIALRERKPIAMFSLEMDKEDLVTRMLCSVAKVDSKRVRIGTPHDNDWGLLVEAAGKISQGEQIFIDDASVLTPMQLRTKARRLHHQLRESGGLGCIVIDYLQLMDAGKKADNRQAEISYISRSLKSLARELQVPIVALSQLSRAVEMRNDKRPMLSDLRESGAIEQDADMVIFLHRPEYYDKDNPDLQGRAEVIIAKHRNGEIGSFELAFRAKYTQFVNLAKPHHEQGAPASAIAAFGNQPSAPVANVPVHAGPASGHSGYPDTGGSIPPPPPGGPIGGDDEGMPF